VFIVNPFGERQRGVLALAVIVMLRMVLTFGLLGAAVFAEPTVTEIEEMCSLVHIGSAVVLYV